MVPTAATRRAVRAKRSVGADRGQRLPIEVAQPDVQRRPASAQVVEPVIRRRGSSEAGSERHNDPAPAALPRTCSGRGGAAAEPFRIRRATEECDTYIDLE